MNDRKTVYVDIDSHVHYDAFYDDFGPLNLAVLFRFCQFLHALVLHHGPGGSGQQAQQQKRIFLYTSADPKNRVNAVFLVASYMILYHHLTAEQAYLRLQAAEPPPFIGFRDASLGPPSYLLHVQHVIKACKAAIAAF
uniref:Dual specificity/tyrosine protein phosphatase N-terminal domain-containing protein n=1 Tax=Globodera rostochiensis TaxID=31243 RepID=A0A914HTF1_GLORO